MKALRCIVADDEPLAMKLIESYVRKTDGLELAGGYTSATEALEAIRRADADIAFLDIQMPSLSGLVEGFRVNALDYLLKPVSYAEFLEAVDRARESAVQPGRDDTPGHIMVRSDYRMVCVEFDDIIYVEGLKDYVKFYTASRERPLLTQMSLKAVEQALPEASFMRVHRSFIVALGRVESFGRSSIILRDSGTQVPIGDTYRTQFMQRMG